MRASGPSFDTAGLSFDAPDLQSIDPAAALGELRAGARWLLRRMSSWSAAGRRFATVGRTLVGLWRRIFPVHRGRGAGAPSWRGETLIATGR